LKVQSYKPVAIGLALKTDFNVNSNVDGARLKKKQASATNPTAKSQAGAASSAPTNSEPE